MSAAGVRTLLSRGPATKAELMAALNIVTADKAGRSRLDATLRDLMAMGVVVKAGAEGQPPHYSLFRDYTIRGGVQARLAKAVKLRARKGQATNVKDLAALEERR